MIKKLTRRNKSLRENLTAWLAGKGKQSKIIIVMKKEKETELPPAARSVMSSVKDWNEV
jgi:hypothetical protein